MEFRLLGPIEADRDGAVALGGAKPAGAARAPAAARGRGRLRDRLIEALWADGRRDGGAQPRGLRLAAAQGARPTSSLATRRGGYVLEVEPEQIDVHRFERLLEDGQAGERRRRAGRGARERSRALALWRGPALADSLYEPFAQTEIARLEELRLVALEERIEADLALGRHDELVAELEALVGEAPLRERLRGQLMLALYRSGRQADALRVYADTRQAARRGARHRAGPAACASSSRRSSARTRRSIFRGRSSRGGVGHWSAHWRWCWRPRQWRPSSRSPRAEPNRRQALAEADSTVLSATSGKIVRQIPCGTPVRALRRRMRFGPSRRRAS